jgi:predicted MFS family arabinose efflux permease
VRLAFIVLLTVLTHLGFVGSRVTVALFALSLGATPFVIGVLMSLYAVLPMLLAVATGRLMDRVGVFRPLAVAGAALAAAILLPFAWPAMPALFPAALAAGAAFMVQHVGLNHVVGAMGGPGDRAVNFSWFSVSFAIGGFFGPLLAGFAIDHLGHRIAFLLLALSPAAGTALLLWKRPPLPAGHGARERQAGHRVTDLLREPQLFAAFAFSGVLAMGWDLYSFIVPVYGSQIGLSASTIGIIMGAFAVATFIVRMGMPALSRRLREWTVVAAALLISGFAYTLFPFVVQVPLLMALSFLLGIGLGCAQPMIMALLYAASPQGRQGEVVGLRSTVLGMSTTVTPLAYGAAGSAFGVGPVLWVMAALLLAAGWLAGRRS